MQARCQPYFAAPSVLFSCREPFVSESLAIYRENETVEPIQRVLRHSSRVQAKGNLVHISPNMLRAHLMPRTVNAALQECTHALDRVRVDVALRILAFAVIDGAVIEPEAVQSFVTGSLIGADQIGR